MSASAEAALQPRGGANRVLGRGGKPLLVIVEGKDVNAMLAAGLQAIGGLQGIIGGRRQVLLKPNTNQRDPFPSITAPEMLRAVARQCRAAGAERVIVHEDHKQELDLYYSPADLPGIRVELSHAPDPDHYVLVENAAWRGDRDPDALFRAMAGHPWVQRVKQMGYRRTEGPRLRVARQLQEAPVIINLPVLKRHFAGQITSALKNHFGSVYGLHRWLAHVSLESDRDYFDRKLAEFASAVRPELTITDVRSLQAVSGPGRGDDTRIVEGVNRMIISGDMVAADTVALDLMKEYDPSFTPANEAIVRRQHKHAEQLGLGSSDLSRCEVIQVKA